MVRAGYFERGRRHALSHKYSSGLAAISRTLESGNLRFRRNAHCAARQRTFLRAALSTRNTSALCRVSSPALGPDLCLVVAPHKNEWHLDAQLSAAQQKRPVPMGTDLANFRSDLIHDFFFFTLTLISIPGAIACNCSSPCLACAPHGPFGSRSTAFW